jgi:hypothetical protein
MPKASADTSLVSSLHQAAVNDWDPTQANKISARLVSLLPHAGVTANMTPNAARKPHAPALTYLLMWLGW